MEEMIQFGVVYYPSGSFRECANEHEARRVFRNAPQAPGESAHLVVDWESVDSYEPYYDDE